MLYPLSYGGPREGYRVAPEPLARATRGYRKKHSSGPHGLPSGLTRRATAPGHGRTRPTDGRDGGGRPRRALRSQARRPRRRPGQLPRRRRHDDLPHTEVDPSVGGRASEPPSCPACWTRRVSVACTSCPTAPSCATTSSSTPRRSTSSPPRTATGSARPLPAEPRRTPAPAAPARRAGLPRLRQCLKDTLYRLAQEQSRLFAGRPVHVSSPQGRFEAGAALLDGRVLDQVFSYGKHLAADFDTARAWACTAATPPAPAPPPARGALRMRWEGPGPEGTASGPTWRPTVCEVLSAPDVDRILARLGPVAPCRRRSGASAHRRQSHPRRRPADGPDGARGRPATSTARSLLFRHGVSPFRPGRGLEPDLWSRMWGDLVALMRSGVRMGRIVTTRPEDRTRRRRRNRTTPTTCTAAPACRAGSAARGCAPR